MAVNPHEQVVFRDYPEMSWLFGLITLAAGTIAGIAERNWDYHLFTLIGIVIIALGPILTVTVDHRRGMLILRYRSLFRVLTKAYPLSEICFVNVAEDREGERMYRLELILRSGQTVPLRSWYSVGKGHYERRARRLQSALRVGGGVSAPGSNIRITISKR